MVLRARRQRDGQQLLEVVIEEQHPLGLARLPKVDCIRTHTVWLESVHESVQEYINAARVDAAPWCCERMHNWLVVPVIRSCQSPIRIWLANYLHLHLHAQGWLAHTADVCKHASKGGMWLCVHVAYNSGRSQALMCR